MRRDQKKQKEERRRSDKKRTDDMRKEKTRVPRLQKVDKNTMAFKVLNCSIGFYFPLMGKFN